MIENKRGYELMLINQIQGVDLTLTGSQLWQPQDEQKQYLAKLITHYQRIVSANLDAEPLVQSALSDYQALYHKLF